MNQRISVNLTYFIIFLGTEDEDDTDEIEIHASSFTPKEDGEEDGELLPIEDDAEWEMIEETLNTFLDEEEEDEE